jgi:hypothetical protein
MRKFWVAAERDSWSDEERAYHDKFMADLRAIIEEPVEPDTRTVEQKRADRLNRTVEELDMEQYYWDKSEMFEKYPFDVLHNSNADPEFIKIYGALIDDERRSYLAPDALQE